MRRVIFTGRNGAQDNPEWLRTALVNDDNVVYLPIAAIYMDHQEEISPDEFAARLLGEEILTRGRHLFAPIPALVRALPGDAAQLRDIEARALAIVRRHAQ